MAYIGSTIILHCEFKSDNGSYIDPTNISLKIYDANRNQLGSIIPIDSTSKISVGIYEYPYQVPDTIYGYIYYEFSGTVNGNIILGRGQVNVTWI